MEADFTLPHNAVTINKAVIAGKQIGQIDSRLGIPTGLQMMGVKE